MNWFRQARLEFSNERRFQNSLEQLCDFPIIDSVGDVVQTLIVLWRARVSKFLQMKLN